MTPVNDLPQLLELGNVGLWSLLVGFFSPPVISLIQQNRWTPRAKSIVAFAFYLAVGAVTAYFSGVFTVTGLATAILVVFVTAANSYKALWRPTGVAPAIESATSPAPVPNTEPKHRA